MSLSVKNHFQVRLQQEDSLSRPQVLSYSTKKQVDLELVKRKLNKAGFHFKDVKEEDKLENWGMRTFKAALVTETRRKIFQYVFQGRVLSTQEVPRTAEPLFFDLLTQICAKQNPGWKVEFLHNTPPTPVTYRENSGKMYGDLVGNLHIRQGELATSSSTFKFLDLK